MISSWIPPLLGLSLLGGLVALDERGLFSGVVRTPVLVGILAGSVGGQTALGLGVGLVFALLWPAPFRSGGHRAMSPGVAALVGAGAVSVACSGMDGGAGASPGSDGGMAQVAGSIAEILTETGNARVLLAVLLGALGALCHQRCEHFLRRRLGARLATEDSGALRARALIEVLVFGIGIGVATAALGALGSVGNVVSRIEQAGWDGGAWPWVVLAAILGAASQLGRVRGKRAGIVEWGVGVMLGMAGGFLIRSVW